MSRASERGRLRTPAAICAVMTAVWERRWKEGLRGERKEANEEEEGDRFSLRPRVLGQAEPCGGPGGHVYMVQSQSRADSGWSLAISGPHRQHRQQCSYK